MTDATQGEPTDLGELVVTGTRPTVGSPRGDVQYEQPEEVVPDTGESVGGGGAWTQEEVTTETERQKDCAAKAFESDLQQNEPFGKNRREFFSFIWNKNNQTVTHGVRGGEGPSISRSEFNAAISDFWIERSTIIGLSHNHPEDVYCSSDDRRTREIQRVGNAYPSDNDWGYADELVSSGVPSSSLTLYITGCDGQTRSFPHGQKDQFNGNRDSGQKPPLPIQPPGCE